MINADKILLQEVDETIGRCVELFLRLDGAHLFITGASGFFGKWLVFSLLRAKACLGIDISVTALTRDAKNFRRAVPTFLQTDSLFIQQGDLTDLACLGSTFSHVIHAAADVGVPGTKNASQQLRTLTAGTERLLRFAYQCGARSTLIVSSGAVYGDRFDPGVAIREDLDNSPLPLDLDHVYGHGKRCAEMFAQAYASDFEIDVKIARCFSFIGPLQDINASFAASSFFRNSLTGQDIQLRTSGLSLRTYLYAGDLVLWLLKILQDGASLRPYNVGSSEPISILSLAQKIAAFNAENCRVLTLKEEIIDSVRANYIPDISRTKEELGLSEWVSLDKALEKSYQWHKLRHTQEIGL